jgi:hypothetical protein
MNIVTRLKSGGKGLTWTEAKGYSKDQSFYATDIDINYKISPDNLISTYTTTEFLNPNLRSPQKNVGIIITVKTKIDTVYNKYEGPITVGPSLEARYNNYGIGLSGKLMTDLGLYDGQVVYFRLKK